MAKIIRITSTLNEQVTIKEFAGTASGNKQSIKYLENLKEELLKHRHNALVKACQGVWAGKPSFKQKPLTAYIEHLGTEALLGTDEKFEQADILHQKILARINKKPEVLSYYQELRQKKAEFPPKLTVHIETLDIAV